MILRCLLFYLLIGPAVFAATTPEGARTLTIRVGTTRTLHSLTITPLDRNVPPGPRVIEWQPQPSKPLVLSGNYRLASPSGWEVTAAGIWDISWQRDGFRILLTLPSERYVVAALSGEAAPDEPLASLKAMAITIRTFALENAARHSAQGFGLCDSTHCQALRFVAVRPEVERAVRETAGETLWFHSHRASVYYTQHCGGESEAASSVWPRERDSYLPGRRLDPYCLRRSSAAWHATLPLNQLSKILRDQNWRTPAQIERVEVTTRTQTGRADHIEITGRGASATLSASSLRFAVDRAAGWNQMRSDWYTTQVVGANLEVSGKGYGHGVGLCQAGAYQMAVEGRSDTEILNFYFPGLTPAITPAAQRWHSTPAHGWTLLSTGSPTDLVQQGNAAWAKAQKLFPGDPAQAKPVVQELPNSELFRQWSHQPGWMLASTRGNLVLLQPSATRRPGPALETLLVHEFLHVLVEQQASNKAPLWLREGLPELLADPHQRPLFDLSAAQVETALAHPQNAEIARHAHQVAGSMAAQLRTRYGLTALRSFLRDGIPPDRH